MWWMSVPIATCTVTGIAEPRGRGEDRARLVRIAARAGSRARSPRPCRCPSAAPAAIAAFSRSAVSRAMPKLPSSSARADVLAGARPSSRARGRGRSRRRSSARPPTSPRSSRSTTTGARPTLITCAPKPQSIVRPRRAGARGRVDRARAGRGAEQDPGRPVEERARSEAPGRCGRASSRAAPCSGGGAPGPCARGVRSMRGGGASRDRAHACGNSASSTSSPARGRSRCAHSWMRCVSSEGTTSASSTRLRELAAAACRSRPIVRSPRARASSTAAQHVRRVAGGRDRDRDVARAAVRFDQAREDALEAVVVADRREIGGVRGERDRRQRAALRATAGRTHSAAMCWASAAEPPLPKSSALPPLRKHSTRIAAPRAIASAESAASARFTRALSSRISRTRAAGSRGVSGIGPPDHDPDRHDRVGCGSSARGARGSGGRSGQSTEMPESVENPRGCERDQDTGEAAERQRGRGACRVLCAAAPCRPARRRPPLSSRAWRACGPGGPRDDPAAGRSSHDRWRERLQRTRR